MVETSLVSPSLGEAICRMAISTSFWRAGVRKRAWALARLLGSPAALRNWLGLGVCNVPPTSGLRFSWQQALCKAEMSPREELKEEVRKGSWGWRLRTESH